MVIKLCAYIIVQLYEWTVCDCMVIIYLKQTDVLLLKIWSVNLIRNTYII